MLASTREGKQKQVFYSLVWGHRRGALLSNSSLIVLTEGGTCSENRAVPEEAKSSPDTLEEQLQGSEGLVLESYQSWGKAEKYQGDQDGDNWEYSILDLSTQADCYYRDPFSEEGGQAPNLAGSNAYTSISQEETGKWEAEEDKATFQTLWMGKWGGL